MEWFDLTEKYHERTFDHDCRLSSLPTEWQREMAALWRLEADVNNGAYLQFLSNWGWESYEYASQALKKIGAHRMAEIVDSCQALVDEHFDCKEKPPEELDNLMPGTMLDPETGTTKEVKSVLPEPVVKRIYYLSYEFMEYPDDIEELGLRYYRSFVESDNAGETSG